jgi:long-chain acyl-CoA synthetase
MKKMSLFDGLTEKYGENKAIISDEGITLTYNELSKVSESIQDKSEKRSLVFCLCKNVIGSFCGYFSFVKNGIVPLMLDATLDNGFLEALIATYKPQYLWMPADQISNSHKDQVIFSTYSYSLVKLKSETTPALYENLGLLLTTSGSTGSPKLVRLSYENLEANAVSIAEYLGIDDKERPITTLPMNYSFGLSIINSHLLSGSTILLTSKTLMEKEFWTFLKEYQATSLSGVPYTFEILKKLRFFRMNLPSLKTLTQAGGKLNNELNKEFSEFSRQSSKRFFVMYGQTEATARMSYLPPAFNLEKLGSMGIAIPGGEFSLIDETSTVINGHDIVGELVYKGKNVSLGYAESLQDLSKEDENKGVLITGDMAKKDSDNFYYIVGRKKRFIKIYGNRVNLDETERMLKNIVSDCACTGKDDHLVIYITEKKRSAEVEEFLLSKTKINHSAFSIRHIDEIPKNSSGKTIYSILEV